MEKVLQRNICLFYLYRFLSRFYMYLPLFIIFLIHFELSYMQMSMVVAVHGIAIMLFKIPLKYLLNAIASKKKILFAGEIIKCIGLINLAMSNGRFEFLLGAQIINGIGFALTTSIESSLLFNSMQHFNAEQDYRQVEAKSQGFSFVSVFFAGIIGSLIADKNLILPIYISAFFSFLSAVNILFFSETLENHTPGQVMETGKEQNTSAPEMKQVYPVLLYYAFNRAIILAVFVFIFPIFLMEVFNIDIIFFGMILGLFSLTAYITGHNFEKLSGLLERLHLSLWSMVPVFLLLSVLLLISKNMYLLFAVPILLGFAGISVRPLSVNRINTLIANNRSMVMSRGEQIFGFLNAVFVLILGGLFTHTSLISALLIFCGIILSGMIIIHLYFKYKYKPLKSYNKSSEPPVDA